MKGNCYAVARCGDDILCIMSWLALGGVKVPLGPGVTCAQIQIPRHDHDLSYASDTYPRTLACHHIHVHAVYTRISDLSYRKVR